MKAQVTSVSTLSAIAILIGSALVAWVLYEQDKSDLADGSITIQRQSVSDRHIYGSKKADTVIIEFSDYECPFCARVHDTIKQIVDESNGTIAWEYRHFPLSFHPQALPTALVAECLAKETDNDTFWEFTDTIFANQNQLSPDYVASVVKGLGVEPKDIESCVTDEKITKAVTTDMDTAKALGGSGTPFSIILFPDGTYKPVSGALPLKEWQLVLDSYEAK